MSLTLCLVTTCTFLTLGEDDTTARGCPRQGEVWTTLRQARLLCWAGRYTEAEAAFRRVAQDVRLPYAANEEARFCQAETLRLQGRHVRAAEAYCCLLREFPFGLHVPQAREHLFDIANDWLNATRDEMEDTGRPQCKRMLTHKEARAVRALDEVFSTDPTGPLAAKACFFMGSVCFFREDYAEASWHYINLAQHKPNHPLAPRALEMAVTATVLGVVDGALRGGWLAEARQLLDRLRKNYPEAAGRREEFLAWLGYEVDCLEAARELEHAGLLEGAGWLTLACPVYACLPIRYPGTAAAAVARRRLDVLRTSPSPE